MMRLLLVEDHELDRESIRRSLERAEIDMALDEAACLCDARRLLETERYDCILSDLSLPDGEGLELLTSATDAAFVILTGAVDDRRGQEALTQGAQDYLLKDRLDPYWLGRSLNYAIERKRLQLIQREVEHQDRLVSLGQLAASVAHEINNPTAFIAANLESMRMTLGQVQSPKELADAMVDLMACVDESRHGTERIASIVRQLRSFARGPDDAEATVEVDMTEVVEWAVALTKSQLQQVARFETVLDVGGARFMGRPGRLSQVMTNLLINAADSVGARPSEGAAIVLTVSAEPERILFAVDDSGPGLSDALKEKALQPFFTTKAPGHGTGLGLSVANEIILGHGGHLRLADSSLGGLRVEVTLPIRQYSLKPQRHEAETLRAGGEPLTLLLIDDEIGVRRAYKRLLRPHVVHAFAAVQALDWLEEPDHAATVDAVICDVMMPDLDGPAVYEALAVRHPRLASRFVFCSGGPIGQHYDDDFSQLRRSVVYKPVARDALLAAVYRQLDT